MKKIIALAVLVISLVNCSYGASYITNIIEVYKDNKVISYLKFTTKETSLTSSENTITLLNTKLEEVNSFLTEDNAQALFEPSVKVVDNTMYITYSFNAGLLNANYRIYSFDLNLKLKDKIKLTGEVSTFLFDDQGFSKLILPREKNEKVKIERYNYNFKKVWEYNEKNVTSEFSLGTLLTKVDNNLLMSEISSQELNSTEGKIKLIGINSLSGKLNFTTQLNEGETNVIGIPKVLYNATKKEYTLIGQYFENIKNVAEKKTWSLLSKKKEMPYH